MMERDTLAQASPCVSRLASNAPRQDASDHPGRSSMVATTAPFSTCHRRSKLASLVEHNLSEWTDRMGADWDVVIIGGGAAGIGAAAGWPPVGFPRCCWKPRSGSAAAPGRSTWPGMRSTSAAAGFTRPIAIHGSTSPKHRALPSTAASPAWRQQYRDLGFPRWIRTRPMKLTRHGTNVWSPFRRKATAPPMPWNRVGRGTPIFRR